jgi:hypothetical protein
MDSILKTNTSYITILVCSLTILFGLTAQTQTLKTIDILSDVVIPRSYIIYHTEDQIKIDGKADESAWMRIPFTESFIDIEGVKNPLFDTQVKMLWSNSHLYIYAELEEPHIAANLTQHDTIIFFDKDFEVFIDPTDDTYQYIEVEINALNTTWDLYLDKPYRNLGKALNAFEIKGFKSAIGIHGTLNDASDADTMWTVELAIPLDVALQVAHKGQKHIVDGDYWRMNFSRVHWDQKYVDGKYRRLRDKDGQLLKEYNWVWSNQKVINMHEPEKWGYVYFSTDRLPTMKKYGPDPLMHDKQVAYACYRKTRQKEWKYLKKTSPGFRESFIPILYDNFEYDIEFIKTNGGFEFVILNKSTGNQYAIDEMSYLKKIK